MVRAFELRTLPSKGARAVALVAVMALGVTACSAGDSPEAKQSATVAPDPERAGAALDAGLEAHSAGDLTAATAKYEEALKYEPTNQYAFYNLALIDESMGNYGLAEEKYRAALETDPAYEPALFNLAILRTGRDPQEAIELYERAVAANDQDASAWLNLGLLLRASGDKKKGDKSVLKALALNPSLKDPAES